MVYHAGHAIVVDSLASRHPATPEYLVCQSTVLPYVQGIERLDQPWIWPDRRAVAAYHFEAETLAQYHIFPTRRAVDNVYLLLALRPRGTG